MLNMSKKWFFFGVVLWTFLLPLNPAQAKIVAFYPFDGDVQDHSGNGKHGVYWSNGNTTASPVFKTDHKGNSKKALSLQSFDSYDSNGVGGMRIEQGVILPDETYFDFANAITISCWVKFNSVMSVYPQGWFSALVTKSRASDQWSMQTNWNTGAQRLAWRIGHQSSVTSTMSIRPGTTNDKFHLAVDNYGKPAWNTWYHVTTTYDAMSGWARIYLNGELSIETQQTSADKSIGDRNDANSAAAIGIYAKSDYTPWGTGESDSDSQDGLIDEVIIFDNALTPQQVALLYQNGAYCSIEETQGSTDVDANSIVVPATDEYKINFVMNQPDKPVTITVGGYNPDLISVYPKTLVISSPPWEYSFTVTAINNTSLKSFQTTYITHTATSDDPHFNWGHNTNYLPDVVVSIYKEGSLIRNGDFELPSVQESAPNWMAIPADWQITGKGGIRKWNSKSGNNQVLFSQGRSEFQQDAGVSFLVGKTYILSVDIGQFDNTQPSNYTIQLRDAESDSVWAEADQDDLGYPAAGTIDLTGRISYTVPASGGPAGKQVRIFLQLNDNSLTFDNVTLYLVDDPVNLTMSVIPSDKGINTIYPSAGQTTFTKGSSVYIKAASYYGWPEVYKFDRWVGQGITNPNSSQTTVLMDQDKNVTAVYVNGRVNEAQWHTIPVGDFSQDGIVDTQDLVIYEEKWLLDASQPQQYQLYTSVSGGNGSLTPASGFQKADSTVTLTAVPETEWKVKSWNGTDNDSSAGLTNTVRMTENKTVSVLFEKIEPIILFGLSWAVPGGNGSLSVDPVGQTDPNTGIHYYEPNILVTITASPAVGYKVKSWSGTSNDSSVDTINTVTMTAGKNVSVLFEEVEPAPVVEPMGLTLLVHEGNGSLSADPEGQLDLDTGIHYYNPDTTVALSASPANGYELYGWSGTNDDDSKDLSNTVTMTSDKTVAVYFHAIAQPIIVKKMTVKADKSRKPEDQQDRFIIQGIFNARETQFSSAESATIRIKQADTSIMDSGPIPITSEYFTKSNKSAQYRCTQEGVNPNSVIFSNPTSLCLIDFDFDKGNFMIAGRNLSLAGLKSPVTLEIAFGDFLGTNTVDDKYINGNKPLPMILLVGEEDILTLSREPKVSKNGDSLKVIGEITSDATVNLANTTVTVTWANKTFVIPSGQFYRQGNKEVFICKNVEQADNTLVSAIIDLDKAVYNVSLKNAANLPQTGAFNISFSGFQVEPVTWQP